MGLVSLGLGEWGIPGGGAAGTHLLATLTHTWEGGGQQLCQNLEQEENKELYMTKDMISVLFQIDGSLLVEQLEE